MLWRNTALLKLLHALIKQKNVLVLGYGREGKSTLRRLLQAGGAASITVADQNEVHPENATVSVISGPDYLDILDRYDVVFKSPGIVLPKNPEAYTCLITSQMEIFFQAYRDRIIGITGTKGKSTTTTLLYHILKESGQNVVLAGNIGIPAFDILEEIGPDTSIVCELSCHQLEYIHVSPHMAVLLNIHEEHLDHYGTMEKYVHSKQQIYFHQTPDDLLFCGMDVLPAEGTCLSQIYTVSDTSVQADIRLSGTCIHYGQHSYQIPADDIHLLGHHNHLDIAFVYAVCHVLNISDRDFDRGLRSYEPLPHRLHFAGIRDGVRYYDDSISTICDTTIQALKSVPSVGSVLIGGMDRGIDYGDLIRFLSEDQVPHIILMEATGKRILEEIHRDYPDFQHPERLHPVKDLKEAVACAREVTPKGSACILSPAAASYGIFKNFEERGDRFIQYVFS